MEALQRYGIHATILSEMMSSVGGEVARLRELWSVLSVALDVEEGRRKKGSPVLEPLLCCG